MTGLAYNYLTDEAAIHRDKLDLVDEEVKPELKEYHRIAAETLEKAAKEITAWENKAKEFSVAGIRETEEEPAHMKFVQIEISKAMDIIGRGNLEGRLYYLGTEESGDLHNLEKAGHNVDVRDVREYRWFLQE